jgi:hypothetical protein
MAHGPDTRILLQRIAQAERDLDVSGLNITSLPELPTGLYTLSCYNTHITSLPKLPALLWKLQCWNTPLTSLPKLPTRLMHLDCHQTQITSLPELPDSLQVLSCSYTPLTTLPELPAGLQRLFCDNTQITTLPELPDGLKVLSVRNTPLLQPNFGEKIADYKIRLRETQEARDLASAEETIFRAPSDRGEGSALNRARATNILPDILGSYLARKTPKGGRGRRKRRHTQRRLRKRRA